MANFTTFLGTGIRDEVGSNRASLPDDVTRVQRVMRDMGYLPVAKPANGILDRDLDGSLRRFQRDQGLRVDGWMRPDGPTHRSLNSELEANLRAGSVVHRRSDDPGHPSTSRSRPATGPGWAGRCRSWAAARRSAWAPQAWRRRRP